MAGPSSWTDEVISDWIGHLLRVGVVLSAAVIAGTGAPSARQAAALTADAASAGADAALVLSPPGAADVRPYYRYVADAVPGIPLLAYHFPGVAPPGIPVGALADLPIVGCKDSSGDPDRLLAELVGWDGHLYVGSSAILALAGPLGCTGATGVVGIRAPRPRPLWISLSRVFERGAPFSSSFGWMCSGPHDWLGRLSLQMRTCHHSGLVAVKSPLHTRWAVLPCRAVCVCIRFNPRLVNQRPDPASPPEHSGGRRRSATASSARFVFPAFA